jgi:hypothetical protein
VPDTLQDEFAKLVNGDFAVQGGAQVMKGVDFRDKVDGGGGE